MTGPSSERETELEALVRDLGVTRPDGSVGWVTQRAVADAWDEAHRTFCSCWKSGYRFDHRNPHRDALATPTEGGSDE